MEDLPIERVAELRLDYIKRLREQVAELEAALEEAKTESLRLDWEYEILWTWLAENTNLLSTIEPFIEEWKERFEEARQATNTSADLKSFLTVAATMAELYQKMN